MKKMFLTIGISSGIIILLVILYFVFTVTGVFSVFMPNPPKPEITYGEFPFQLTYEIDGETKVIEDTIICEFDGFESRGTAGKYRVWKSYLKSGNERITLLDLRPLELINELDYTILELFFYWGNAAYYMGDNLDSGWKSAQSFDEVNYLYKTKDETIGGSVYKADEAYEKYKIKLISWEIAPPIQNSFK